MKTLKFISIFLTCILVLFACKMQKEIVYEQKRDSVYVQKLIPVSLPSDTSFVKALLQCNANGRIAIEKLSIETTKNARLSLILDSIGNLRVQTIVDYDTIYLPSDSIHIKTVLTEFVKVPVKIPLSGWQSFCLKFGRAAFWVSIGIVILATIFLVIKLKK